MASKSMLLRRSSAAAIPKSTLLRGRTASAACYLASRLKSTLAGSPSLTSTSWVTTPALRCAA